MSAVYITKTGKTYIPLLVCGNTNSQTSIVYNLYSYSRGEGTTYIDWGDGTVDSYSDVDTAMTTEHTYELNGNPYVDYVIAIWVDGDRTVSFSGADNSQAKTYSFIKNSTNNEINKIKGIYIGANVYPDYQYLLYKNYYVERVTIPNNTTNIAYSDFSGSDLTTYAQRLKNIFLPSDINRVNARFVYSLEYLSLPKSATSVTVKFASKLDKLVFPNGCGGLTLWYNMNVTKLVIPESLRSISSFTGFSRIEEVYINRSSIKNGSITSLIGTPSSKASKVPLSPNHFTNVSYNSSSAATQLYFYDYFGYPSSSDYHPVFIYVPIDSLDAYKSGTNWTIYNNANTFVGI